VQFNIPLHTQYVISKTSLSSQLNALVGYCDYLLVMFYVCAQASFIRSTHTV